MAQTETFPLLALENDWGGGIGRQAEAITVFSEDYFPLDSSKTQAMDRFKQDSGRPSVDVQASISVIRRRTSYQKEYETSPGMNIKQKLIMLGD
jgi:hypothetical protein